MELRNKLFNLRKETFITVPLVTMVTIVWEWWILQKEPKMPELVARESCPPPHLKFVPLTSPLPHLSHAKSMNPGYAFMCASSYFTAGFSFVNSNPASVGFLNLMWGLEHWDPFGARL